MLPDKQSLKYNSEQHHRKEALFFWWCEGEVCSQVCYFASAREWVLPLLWRGFNARLCLEPQGLKILLLYKELLKTRLGNLFSLKKDKSVKLQETSSCHEITHDRW